MAGALGTDTMRATVACLAAALLAGVLADQPERDYYFVIKQVEIASVEDYVEIPELDVVMLSSECSYLDAFVIVKKDLPDKTMIEISPEKLVSNSWSALSPTGPMKMCEYMEHQKDKMEMLWRASNFTRECPILKNDVILDQFTVMESVFPKEIDGDEWRVRLVLSIDSDEILNLKVHVLKLPIEKKEKCEKLKKEDEDEEEDE